MEILEKKLDKFDDREHYEISFISDTDPNIGILRWAINTKTDINLNDVRTLADYDFSDFVKNKVYLEIDGVKLMRVSE